MSDDMAGACVQCGEIIAFDVPGGIVPSMTKFDTDLVACIATMRSRLTARDRVALNVVRGAGHRRHRAA